MFSDTLLADARSLLEVCRHKKLTLVTAESCTGGLITSLLTEIAGSSDVVDRGFVTYSNQAKQDMLGVPATLLEHYGAVSAEVAHAMAQGALKHSYADIAVSVTGIAGPGGATSGKPVGLIYIAVALKGAETQVKECHFQGPRQQVRLAAVREGMDLILEALNLTYSC